MNRLLLSLVACACALVGFGETVVVNEDKTAGGDWTADVAAGVRVKVAELWLNGVRQANGTYQKGDETPWLTGDGRLTVGSLGLVLFVK